MSRLESCNTCSGSGVKAGSTPATCNTCGGSGQVVQAVRTPLGNFQQVRPKLSRSSGSLVLHCVEGVQAGASSWCLTWGRAAGVGVP